MTYRWLFGLLLGSLVLALVTQVTAQPVEAPSPSMWLYGSINTNPDSFGNVTVKTVAVDTPARCIYVIIAGSVVLKNPVVVPKSELPEGRGCQ